jgi:hypothetical protein
MAFKEKLSRYVWNLLITVDQLLNTILGGDPDETMSSRMGKDIREGRCKICKGICYLLNFFEKDHCKVSIEEDEGSRQVTGD